MKALVFHGPWDIGVEDRPDPVVGPGEILLDIIATGICGSDLHGYTGENGRRHPGQVMGHETVGRVVASSADVHDGPAEGDVVTVNPVIGCGHCAACLAGTTQRCPERRVIGVAPDISAAFAQYMVAPAANAVSLPPSVADPFGALVEPFSVGFHAASQARIGTDDLVLVVGGGPIGQAVALAVWRLGHDRVVVSEPDASRRALLESIGLSTVDPSPGTIEEAVADILGDRPTVVIDAVGCTPSLNDALTVSALGARVVLVGMHTPNVEIPAYRISTEERSVIGSFCYSRVEFSSTAEWLAEAPFDLASLVDTTVPLDDASDVFRSLADGSMKASKVLVGFDEADERRP